MISLFVWVHLSAMTSTCVRTSDRPGHSLTTAITPATVLQQRRYFQWSFHLFSPSPLPPFTSLLCHVCPFLQSVCSPAAAHLALSLLVPCALQTSVIVWACAHAVALCTLSIAPVHFYLNCYRWIYTEYHIESKPFGATFTRFLVLGRQFFKCEFRLLFFELYCAIFQKEPSSALALIDRHSSNIFNLFNFVLYLYRHFTILANSTGKVRFFFSSHPDTLHSTLELMPASYQVIGGQCNFFFTLDVNSLTLYSSPS